MLNVEIISVEGFLFQGKANQVVAPVISGEIGFLQGHESLVAELKEGKIQILDEHQNLVKDFAVKSGTVEMFDGQKLVILLDS